MCKYGGIYRVSNILEMQTLWNDKKGSGLITNTFFWVTLSQLVLKPSKATPDNVFVPLKFHNGYIGGEFKVSEGLLQCLKSTKIFRLKKS